MPLISDRCFLPWLARLPGEEETARARKINGTQIARLEEVWRERPLATLEDLERPGAVDDEPQPVLLRYENSQQYRAVFGPLVQLEADYDKQVKESQKQDRVMVRWEQSMSPSGEPLPAATTSSGSGASGNRKWTAWFCLPSFDDADVHLTVGDELRLRYQGEMLAREWEAIGTVVKVPDSHSDEYALQMRRPDVPFKCVEFSVEFVWKSATFDRMQWALRCFATQPTAMSGYIQRRILGIPEDPEESQQAQRQLLASSLSSSSKQQQQHQTELSAPQLAELNHSQLAAVKTVLQHPLSLIQGPPGTGKTQTSATIVFHLAMQQRQQTTHPGPILVCAPSNVAVDQLTEVIHRTGLRVVRLAAKSRESISSSIEFLTLLEQTRNHPGYPDLGRLLKSKDSRGDLSFSEENRLKKLRIKCEMEILTVIIIKFIYFYIISKIN
jgi:regulator of nonsense transcripts 1